MGATYSRVQVVQVSWDHGGQRGGSSAEARVSALQRKGGEGHVRQRKMREGLEGNRTWLAGGRTIRLLPGSVVWGGTAFGRGDGNAGWASKDGARAACMLFGDLCKRRRRAGCHSYPAGTQLLSLVWASLSLIPARPLFPQCWLLCFSGENAVFVLQRLFIQVLPWWGSAGEGRRVRSRSLAAGGQGQPLSPFSALCGLRRALRILSLGTNHIVLGVEREFWANSFSFFIFKNCRC